MFVNTYAIVNSFDKIKIENIAKLFAQLLFTNTISWTVLSTIRLNENQTTAATGHFVKYLFHELAKHMGEKRLNDYVQEP